jgi:hypothetical protein
LSKDCSPPGCICAFGGEYIRRDIYEAAEQALAEEQEITFELEERIAALKLDAGETRGRCAQTKTPTA